MASFMVSHQIFSGVSNCHGPRPKSRSVRVPLGKKRLLHLAAETGARIAREGLSIEPLDWLVKPLRLFEGRSAVECCHRHENFRRACVLHGLGLGLDQPPAVVEGIPLDAFLSKHAGLHLTPSQPAIDGHADQPVFGVASLYCSSVNAEARCGQVQIFFAMVARSPDEVRSHLQSRYGFYLADEAQIRLGFDWSEPLASALVSDAMAHVLSLVRDQPESTFAEGFEFRVEHQFAY